MLNISRLKSAIPTEYRNFPSEAIDVFPDTNRLLRRWLVIMLIIFLAFMFVPWTQNIQSNGMVTTLLPEDRPQTIQSAIAGRVERWYVREGQTVFAGDTIVRLAEIKAEYLDPNLVNRTVAQRDAKTGSADSYLDKAAALDLQMVTLRDQLQLKIEQLDQKIRQAELKIATQEANIMNAENQFLIAEIQYNRSDTLYRRGIDARSKFEEKTNKYRATEAKLTSERNKLAELNNELEILRLSRKNATVETREKIAKAQSDRASALSSYYGARGDVEKLQNQLENYSRRRDFYYVIAPQDAVISEAFVPGVGETIKEGDAIVSMVPNSPQLAVELFVKPMDLPLIQLGQEVRFLFDGWPAIVFGGWPGLSFGTFMGNVVAIDNNTNDKGEYRILVAPDKNGPWPDQLRPGSGARGIALLSDVPLWYELWRQLNGFPADFYQEEEKIEEKKEEKAPVRSVIK
ncbi:MAG: HlyD family efflux transporter periplasmic adaptor subunit [Bacteroidota bacterium]